MVIDVFADQKGRWHWRIHELVSGQGKASIGVPGEGCCTDKGGSCKGFESKSDAEKAGRAYAEAHKIK